MTLPAVLQGRLSIPVVCSPLFIISSPQLVIAQCKAGVVGSFPALNARPAPVLEEWLKQITTELAAYDALHPDKPSAPFAVNQIVHKSNDRLEHDLALCAKYKVPIIITSLGARVDVNEAVHAYVCIVLHDVINNNKKKKAIEKGAAALNPRGERYTPATIRERLTMRDFMDTLRASGIQTGGPDSLSQRDRQAFAAELEKWWLEVQRSRGQM